MKQTARPKQAQLAPPAPPAQKEVRAEKFVLVDSQGRERATLRTIPAGDRSDTALALFDERGHLRLSLREGWQESAVTIFDQVHGGTEEVVRVGYRGDAKSEPAPGLTVFDGIGNRRAYLKVDAEGEGQLTIRGRDGAQTGISSDGLTVWGKDDEIVTEIGILSNAATEDSNDPAPGAPPQPAASGRQGEQGTALNLDKAKAILTRMLTSEGAYSAFDLTCLVQTLVSLDQKTARQWAAELSAHIETVDAADEAEFAEMKARIEQTEAARVTPAGEIRTAYEQLAEGMRAVLALDSTDNATKNLLGETAEEIWNSSANRDIAGNAYRLLLHVGEWKAQHAQPR